MASALASTTPLIAVLGLGYVGLPLAVEFGKKFRTIGFDINSRRVAQLRDGIDWTGEKSASDIAQAEKLSFSDAPQEISHCNRYVVCVPTPINETRDPDFAPLIGASEIAGKHLKKGDIVIYESTVYPGATEEICVPILERESGLVFNVDFFVGYSPERVNPGDTERPITSIIKVTSGSTPDAAAVVDDLYKSIITAGTYRAGSIKVAEASKIIENIQRDLNIALMNELAQIFSLIGIDTVEVIEAAETKWNFVKVRPGLVGGHCISVDPYYMVKKSLTHGFVPDIIQTARKINESMPEYAASKLVRAMVLRGMTVKDAKILILGVTFKENCADIRNSKVKDMIAFLKAYGVKITVYDPWAQNRDIKRMGADNIAESTPELPEFDAVVLAVAHHQFKAMGHQHLRSLLKPNGILFDIKSIYKTHESDLRL
jgi:UDP-N-acetyl-D-glucosamine/UDP-N-acetyl-D-galactosamine dehydrogenase